MTGPAFYKGCFWLKKGSLLILAVLIIAAAAWYSYYTAAFNFLFLNDAMDYASIGRNVSRGDGFVSSYITPLGLANREGLPHSDLWRAPLWPAILSVFIKLIGPTDQAVAIATGFFFIAGSLMVFLLAKEMFGRLVAFASSLIFIFSGQNLYNSVSGMTETLSVFLMTLTVYLLVASRARNKWGDLLAGAALGLFYLARYNALLFVPFFAGFIWYRRREEGGRSIFGQPEPGRGRLKPFLAAARLLAAFLIVISPWLVRNYLVMGDPLFSLQKYEPVMFTSEYPEYSLYMIPETPNVAEFLKAHPEELGNKVSEGWNTFVKGLFDPQTTGVSPYLFGLFLAALVLPFNYWKRITRDSRLIHGSELGERWQAGHSIIGQKGIRPLVLACFIIQLAALLVVHFIYRLFFIFMPFYIIYGVAALVWFLNVAADRLPVRKNGFVGLFTVLVVGLFIASNLPSWDPLKKEEMPITGLRESVKGVTDMSTREELIISNDGHLVAWYGDRYAAKLPYRVDMIPEMEKLAPLKFIYLSSRISWNIPEAHESWGKLFWSKPKEIYGFSLARVFPDGSVIYRKD